MFGKTLHQDFVPQACFYNIGILRRIQTVHNYCFHSCIIALYPKTSIPKLCYI